MKKKTVEVYVELFVIVMSSQCITWYSQYKLILFVALSSLSELHGHSWRSYWKCGR